MESSTVQTGIVFTEKELALYAACPELQFNGGHTSGFPNCPYCANVYRTYRRLQNEHTPQAPPPEDREDEPEQEEQAPKQKSLDDNAECTKLPCMKAGWCMCD
jgi:hypothetical protein